MSKSLLELAAEIVTAQASKTPMTSESLSSALKSAYGTLAGIKALEDGDTVVEVQAEAIPDKLAQLREHPKHSIKQNSVVCLECGAEFKMLTGRHTKLHGMTLKEYKKKWGMTAKQPLTSKALSQKRRDTAERLGLKDKLAKAREKRKANLQETSQKSAPEVNLFKDTGVPKKTSGKERVALKKK